MRKSSGCSRFLPFVLWLSIQANGQKCATYSCDSAIVADILAKNENAVKSNAFDRGDGRRIDTLILDSDPLKSGTVRTAVGIHRIVDLSELKYLDLGIHWADSIPEDLDKLDKLETLRIGIPQLTTLPAKTFGLAALKTLDLEGCRVRVLDEGIGMLVRLEYLSLYASDLTSLPASIGDLALLRFLNLADNELGGFPSTVMNLRNLDTLHCWYNRLCGLDPAMEAWVDSTEVYPGWEASQDCSVSARSPRRERFPGISGYRGNFFDALGRSGRRLRGDASQ